MVTVGECLGVLQSAAARMPDAARRQGLEAAIGGIGTLAAEARRQVGLLEAEHAAGGYPAVVAGQLPDLIGPVTGGGGGVSPFYSAEICLRFSSDAATAAMARDALAELRHGLLLLGESVSLLGRGGDASAVVREISMQGRRIFGEA